MTISNESRGRIKKVFEPIALGMGRIGLTPNGLTLIGFGDHRRRRVLAAPSCGSSAASSSSSAACSTCSTARWPARPARPAVRGVHGLDLRQAGRDRRLPRLHRRPGHANVGTVPSSRRAAMGASIMVSYTRAKSDALGFSSGMGLAAIGVMPREIRLIVLSLGLIIDRATAQPHHPSRQPSAIIAIGAVITVIQRILQTRSQASRPTSTRLSKQQRRDIVAKNRTNGKNGSHAGNTGQAPGAAATARSGSPSSASGTAPAASSRDATTTRTPRRTTSSRA